MVANPGPGPQVEGPQWRGRKLRALMYKGNLVLQPRSAPRSVDGPPGVTWVCSEICQRAVTWVCSEIC